MSPLADLARHGPVCGHWSSFAGKCDLAPEKLVAQRAPQRFGCRWRAESVRIIYANIVAGIRTIPMARPLARSRASSLLDRDSAAAACECGSGAG